MEKGVIIQASARSIGNTSISVAAFNNTVNFDVIDLNTKHISHFDYEFKNANDDFAPLFKHIVKTYSVLIFATPIYWYTMSGLLKVFFDRISDFLIQEKAYGRLLRGKYMGVISNGLTNNVTKAFAEPFIKSADYLGMSFLGYQHSVIENGKISETTHKQINALALKCKQVIQNKD